MQKVGFMRPALHEALKFSCILKVGRLQCPLVLAVPVILIASDLAWDTAVHSLRVADLLHQVCHVTLICLVVCLDLRMLFLLRQDRHHHNYNHYHVVMIFLLRFLTRLTRLVANLFRLNL